MKRILITGAGSYIGTSFENYMNRHKGDYLIDTVDMIGEAWREYDFSGYDSIIHVAGIAHIKETEENKDLYYKVNRDLVIDVANKAKKSGVAHFVFLSTMSVYGVDTGVITPRTEANPVSNYGKSKYQAEKMLEEMASESFSVCIVRPPMVYGKDCLGNFRLLLKLATKSPIFPKINNERSMIYIDNLSAFLKLMVDGKHSGIFMPQNKEYVNTTKMARIMADTIGHGLFCSALAGLGVKILIPFVGKAKKAFGTLIYKDCEQFDYCYCVEDFESSVRKSVQV